jgi:acyl dehydratase
MARFEDIEIGDEFPFEPDVSLDTVKRFTGAARMTFARFTDHEQAKKEGLPGAIVPGIMSQAILVAAIHGWNPDAEVKKIDTVFRAPLLVDSKPVGRCTVTHTDPDARTLELDLVLANEQDETRVMGTAIVAL